MAEFLVGELQAGFDEGGVLLDGEGGIFVVVVKDPALALSDDLVAEFFGGEVVSPFAEGAFGEFLDVAFVHQGDDRSAAGQRELNGHANEALGTGDGDGFDADTGVQADLLLAAFEHVFVQEVDELGCLGSSLLPLDAGVDIFGILAVDDDVHEFGMLHGRGCAFVVPHGTHAGVEIQDLAQGNVQRADAAAHWCGQRAFDSDAEVTDGVDGVIGEPVVEFGFGFLSGEDFVPGHSSFIPIRSLNGSIEHTDGSLPDVAARPIAFDVRNDGSLRDVITSARVGYACTIRRHRKTVVGRHHQQPPDCSEQ